MNAMAGGRMPRVHFVGNVCNNHYVMAKGLRRIGVDARLFYLADAHPQHFPEAEDPELANGPLPDWIVPVPRQWRMWQQRDRASPDLIAALGQCDILHVHDVGLIWASRTGKPYVWHPYGGDLAVWTSYNRDLLIRMRPFPPLPKLPNFTLPMHMRQAMRGTDGILIGWHNNLWRGGYQLVRRMGLEDRVIRYGLPIDTDKFAPAAPGEREALLASLLPGVTVRRPLIFHPTRQYFTRPTNLHGYKANDRLYRALGRFAADGGTFTLVICEKGNPDEAVARQMIGELGIAPHVHWVKEMPRHRLIPWYQAADLVVDSFFTGCMGSVPIEAMACGTPVMMHFQTEAEPADQGFFLDPKDMVAEPPPLVRCRTDDEILDGLRTIVADPAALAELGRQGRDWMVRNLALEPMANRLLAIYQTILTRTERVA